MQYNKLIVCSYYNRTDIERHMQHSTAVFIYLFVCLCSCGVCSDLQYTGEFTLLRGSAKGKHSSKLLTLVRIRWDKILQLPRPARKSNMFGVKAALLARSAPLGILAARRMISMEALNYSHAKIAVVLSGCGLFDGTEIHEASAILVTLSRHLASVTMFAPNILQTHVINHLTGEEMDPERNVLVESARIARGKIRPLKELKAKDFAAVIFPGGFGVAKNLSTFAVDEHRMDVNPQVEDVLKEFHEAEKPIGLCCISPVLVAALFKGVEVTVGADKVIPGKWPHATTAGVIVTMGAVHVPTDVNEIYIDHRHKIVSTAAYMCEAPHHVIFDAISTMVRQVLLLTPSK